MPLGQKRCIGTRLLQNDNRKMLGIEPTGQRRPVTTGSSLNGLDIDKLTNSRRQYLENDERWSYGYY